MSTKEVIELLDILEKAQAQKLAKNDFYFGPKVNFGFLKECMEEYEDSL